MGAGRVSTRACALARGTCAAARTVLRRAVHKESRILLRQPAAARDEATKRGQAILQLHQLRRGHVLSHHWGVNGLHELRRWFGLARGLQLVPHQLPGGPFLVGNAQRMLELRRRHLLTGSRHCVHQLQCGVLIIHHWCFDELYVH